MSRTTDEKWATLEELLAEYHHPEHKVQQPITIAELTDRLRRLSELGLMEIAWDDERNEPIFCLTDAAYEKYRPHVEQEKNGERNEA